MNPMRFRFLVFVFLIAGFLNVSAQATGDITTIILVRHAEKGDDGTSDPDLSEAGKDRAKHLAIILNDTKIDAIYSTNYKRTKNTVTQLAEKKGIEIHHYEPMKNEVIDEILKKHRGGTVVIVGHSNTTPWTANFLLGTEEVQNFYDDEYDNLLIVSFLERGKAAKLTWINY